LIARIFHGSRLFFFTGMDGHIVANITA
jgi:hypothetical protein